MKLFLAAPLSLLPFLSTALGSQASFLHFFTKLVLAAPASALPSLSTALLSQVSCAKAEPTANAVIRATNNARFIFLSIALKRQHRIGEPNIALRLSPSSGGPS